jgi:hypothetical protein
MVIEDCRGWPLMTTAGRRPFSMREIRAARAGSGACALDASGAGAWALERLLAGNLGESSEELEVVTAKSANAAARRSTFFVAADLVVFELVVDFIGDLMSANRTTFECEMTRLVG